MGDAEKVATPGQGLAPKDTTLDQNETEYDEGMPGGSNTGVSVGGDEESRLRALATDVRNQDDLERDIGRQADQLLTEQANERDQKRLEKTRADKE